MEKGLEEKEELRCPKCNSNQVYVRIRTKEIVCHKCGNIELMKGGKNV